MATEEQDNINLILYICSNHKPHIKHPQTSAHKTIGEFEYDSKKLKLRTISFDELDMLRLTWVKQEGWPTISHGLPATYSIDPQGFFSLETDKQRIASISVVSYPSMNFGYVGFFIVIPELRQRGYGGLILNKTLEYSEKFRDINSFGLNCVESMVSMYQQWGFETKTIDQIWKYTAAANYPEKVHYEVDVVDELNADFFKKIVDYDARIFGTAREEYLNKFIHKPSTWTIVYEEDGNVQGYAIMSEREPAKPDELSNLRIGPLYAEDLSIAKLLLRKLMQYIKLKPMQAIILETPGNNSKAAALVQELGFEKVIDSPKMYKGQPPKQAVKQIFAYSSLVTGG